MEKNNTMGKAHDKKHDATTQKPKSSTTTSSGCKGGSCSTSDKKGKKTHMQE
ncbi:MAG: hypothetical protein II299_02585 [Alistipes sp.]|nr:hypothetical protein [Alistipes sp.]